MAAGGSADERLVLEFANTELLELRHLDKRLDRDLEAASRAVSRRRRWPFRGADLRAVAQLQVESTMLYEAVNWHDDGAEERPPLDEVLASPENARYVEHWGRPGDVVFFALDRRDEPVAAAWYRRFPADAPGYGYVADDIARWAQTIAERTSACSEVYVYFKHEEEGKGPEIARMLMEQLRVT